MSSFVLCDVFAPAFFAGNQLAVFLDGHDFSDRAMFAVAREFGWSEVTFVSFPQNRRPRVRIWTPYGELPFAGHPTVGTAVVLAADGRIEIGWTALELGIGPVAVEVTSATPSGGRATMTQTAPQFGSIVGDRKTLARALSLQDEDLEPELPVQVVSTGAQCLIVPVRSLDALGRASVDVDTFPGVADALGIRHGAYVFCADTPGSAAVARARRLGPGMEDAATGSAAGPLGAYLVLYGLHRAGEMTIEQGVEMGRPSIISVDVPMEAGEIGPVRVAGDVRIWGRGEMEIPGGVSPMLEL